ncbi:lytic transglycosylase domain-containing protein [Bacteriovorax sp. Seq25_V]|uniref:lytic transglycosylase domain-containing protein n=1 Tax=Bacteriovorax sp. Seq25_V TaxID=1201288 RepID=UPI00038A018D|nr:lytic transglycosylase domain-containing protein [Bacteriovorax sp. Seq25_V]EQC43239.1 transglycosylase SLT domain protein [Bacteriovorax sp. Seq25_V]
MNLLKVALFSLSFSAAFAQLNNNDIQAAKYIAELERNLLRSNFKTSTINQAKQFASSSKTFKRYLPEIELIQEITKAKNFDCTKLKSNQDRPWGNNLTIKTRSYCYQIQLSKFSKLKNINADKKTWIANTIKFFLENDQSTLVDLLTKLNSKSDLFNHLLNETVEISLEEDITLPQKLLDLIDINSKITSLFQKKLPLSRRNKIILTKEFIKLARSLANEDTPPAQADYLISFHNSNKQFIYPKSAWKRVIIAGQDLKDRGFEKQAFKLFKYAISISQNNDNRNDAIFQALWISLSEKKFNDTLGIISQLKLVEDFSRLSSKNKFWIAYSLYKEGESSMSQHLFNLLIKNNPLNYYSIIAQNYVPHIDEKFMKNKFKSRSHTLLKIKDGDLAKSEFNNLNEMLVWKELNYSSKVDRFIAHFSSLEANDLISSKTLLNDYTKEELEEAKLYFFLDVFKNNNDYLSSFKYLSRIIDSDDYNFNNLDISSLFPTKHLTTIKNHSGNIDPLLVLSIIRQESAFNEKAQSHVGARGLMQLMPSTAKMMGRIRNNDELFVPAQNIKYGVKYLNKLLNRFEGNLILTLSSYNAGPTKVSRWVKNRFVHDDPIFLIEEIPYKETRLYVKLIYRNLFFYNLLDNNYIFDKSLKNTFKVVSNSTKLSKR